ncbi:isochorismatase family protein [Rubeoparvulum massiliense]
MDQGYECHLVTDAVSSRAEENRALGIHRMEQAGAIKDYWLRLSA